MIRFVVAPDKSVVPDIAEKLPGRGVWVLSDRNSLEQAINNGGFKRGFKANVNVSDELMDLTVKLLRQRVLSLMTMALKGSRIYLGFDQVKSAAQTELLGWRIEASDGSSGGRGKIRVLTKAISQEMDRKPTPVIGCFTAAELGQAFGREAIVHAAIKAGPMARSFNHATQRLSGFCELVPEGWEDKIHEESENSAKRNGDKG